MNIYAKEGDKIRFIRQNGDERDRADAMKFLKVGEVYTVRETEYGPWDSEVTLIEVPHQKFSTVMFEDVAVK